MANFRKETIQSKVIVILFGNHYQRKTFTYIDGVKKSIHRVAGRIIDKHVDKNQKCLRIPDLYRIAHNIGN